MMSIESTFQTVIERYYQPKGRIVLGLSGGLDSRAMLELMSSYCQERQIECAAIHVHHGLSVNADLWAEQCRQWCKEAGVALKVKKVALETTGKSLEESAREARYGVLRQYLRAKDLLLTAQHGDDQIETFLLALKRGSGPKGLSAMGEATPFGDATLVRPLLTVTRIQIENYAASRQLTWVEDESNHNMRFDRNFLRHSITPTLKTRWPHFSQAVHRSAELCAEQETLLDELLSERLQQSCHLDGSLHIDSLSKMSALMRSRLIRMWLGLCKVRMPSRQQLDILWQEVALSRCDANPVFSLPNGQVRRFEQRLYWVEQWRDISQWTQSIAFDQPIDLPDHLGTLLLTESHHGRLSFKSLESKPLMVIFEPQGLIARPSERAHSRKLKKLFQEYSVPSWLRRRLPILMCGEQLVAVADLFVEHQFSGQDCELIWDKATSVVTKLPL
ncbi:tRNA lysidine(34) synthetase TilS [Vibrio ostreicida]|uniref:tRNA lysidine(34) synthetase TilS n=1 Tax=Vibrio ostreicida TaxID=526588 RepID=UPI003CCC1AE4